MARPEIRVEGLRELRRDLRKVEGEPTWKPELREANMAAATVVATEAKRTATSGARTISGKSASMGSAALATIRPLAGQTRATVAGGRASIKHYGGWEFGSHGGYSQFPYARDKGYNIYPAIDTKAKEIIEAYAAAIDSIGRKYLSE